MEEEVVTREPLIDVDPPSGEESTTSPAKPAPAADEKKTDTPAATDENANPEQKEAKEQSRRQRKFQRERDARVAAETETRILREQLAARDAKQAPTDGEPKREAYETWEEYQRAVNKYDAAQLLDERLKADREASKGKDAETKQRERQEAQAKTWTEREKQYIEKTPGYDKAVTDYVEDDLGELSDQSKQLIVDSEVGPAVLHQLATVEGLHERIAKLSPLRQVVELGKLEDSLQPKTADTDEKTDEPAKPEGKKISTAPAPIKPVNGGKSGSQGYRENMSDVEYKEWRKSQGAAWAR